MIMRDYWVEVDDFLPTIIKATSTSQAKYVAYKKFNEGHPCTFRRFLDFVSVWLAEETSVSDTEGKDDE